MFTGIVQTKLQIRSAEPAPAGVRLSIDTRGWAPQPAGLVLGLGDSVCVAGVCLTVAHIQGSVLGFDVIPQTLSMTRLGALKPGDWVNIEPSMTPLSQFGGHLVQGHVDGVGTVLVSGQQGPEWLLRVKPGPGLMDYMVPKGAVTIEGVSLTIASLGEDWVQVALIPTTLQITTLGTLKPGDTVNLEADVFAKTIVQFLSRMNPKKL